MPHAEHGPLVEAKGKPAVGQGALLVDVGEIELQCRTSDMFHVPHKRLISRFTRL